MYDELIARGYKRYEPSRIDPEGVECLLQKRFDDDFGKKFFITVRIWRRWVHPYTGDISPQSYEFDIQFSEDDKPINVQFFGGSWTIDEVEDRVEKMWYEMDFDYYEVWDTEERRVKRGHKD